MSANLTLTERKRLQLMAARLAQRRKRGPSWPERIAAELREGPATREELLLALCAGLARKQQKTVGTAITRMHRDGQIRRRPMLEPTGRACRVQPVYVYEIAETA